MYLTSGLYACVFDSLCRSSSPRENDSSHLPLPQRAAFAFKRLRRLALGQENWRKSGGDAWCVCLLDFSAVAALSTLISARARACVFLCVLVPSSVISPSSIVFDLLIQNKHAAAGIRMKITEWTKWRLLVMFPIDLLRSAKM